MKLGILTAPFPDTPLFEVADWAAASGFEALEIAAWPKATGPTRRYAGTSHVDVRDARVATRSPPSPSAAWRFRPSATTRTRSTPTSPTARRSSPT